MEISGHGAVASNPRRMPAAKNISGVEVANILRLLTELRDVTLSRSSHSLAVQLISDLGGSTWQSGTANH